MKKAVLILVLAAASFGFAQSYSEISNAVMDRLGVQEVSCSEIPSADWVYQYRDASCGFIMDTYTQTNRDWAAEKMESFGYAKVLGWQVQGDIAAAGFQGYGRTYMIALSEIAGMTLFIMVDDS